MQPSSWYALETFLEFVITGYCLWAAFYFIYITVCCAVWVVRKGKTMVPCGRAKRGMGWKKGGEGEERRSWLDGAWEEKVMGVEGSGRAVKEEGWIARLRRRTV